MVSTSQQDERINDILDKLQKISTNCSKIIMMINLIKRLKHLF
ncbi:hypothetical protein RPATATE_1122 [Rickettsia parkeri str. Tate's Hell]|uniref:Uncharacterized protein n=1 Tax=Rickettsia parkeri str. Tate's Hell TaxID=1359189 RepID=A0ABR5DR18_RICPA|nr:hypothetical protein [Rickettsia parkeri]AFC74711.1 hypothetical protein MC1_02905 [Rickettsia parkeri str. Portsmouth]KJV95469.1 hypothetical protein RPAAT24_1402 [Rickettsia parkeri str. AT\